MRRRVRQRIVGHVVRVAVRLAAVPEHLHEREDQRPLELVRVVVVEAEGGIDRPRERRVDRAEELALRVGREVRARLQQGRVVHPGHAEHGALEVRGERGERAAHDPALAVAVVEEARACRSAELPAASWKAALRREPVGVEHQRGRGT